MASCASRSCDSSPPAGAPACKDLDEEGLLLEPLLHLLQGLVRVAQLRQLAFQLPRLLLRVLRFGLRRLQRRPRLRPRPLQLLRSLACTCDRLESV